MAAPLAAKSLSLTKNNMPATNELLQEGRYRIDQPASGSDNNVFEAYDTVRKTAVIVREIPVKLNKVMTVSQQESLKIAFTNQAKALIDIQHDSLTPVHDFFSEIDRQYLVMEAIEGDTLAALLFRNKRPFSVEDITQWADQLLDALNYLHSHRPAIIHRNIRPQNLKVTSGRIKLFGVCPDNGSDSNSSEDLRYSPMELIWPGLDAASQKVITNSYDDRSERILKEAPDARSDIYSLGATLYFLVTGIEPVDPLERSIDILEGKLDPLREPTSVNSNISPEISDVLMKALEIKRENRYDSAAIMRQVLQSAVARVSEREEADQRGQEEAAEIVLRSVQAKQEAPKPVVESVRPPVVETPRVDTTPPPPPPTFVEPKPAPAVEQKVAPVIEQKPAPVVEQRAAPVVEERVSPVIEEKAAQPTPTRTETPLPAAAEVMAYRDNETVDEDELAAVLKELEEAESTTTTEPAAVPVETFEKPVIEDAAPDEVPDVEVQHFDTVVDQAPASYEFTATADDDDSNIFSAEKPSFSLPIPAVAGAVVLVLVLAVGGWFVMSGSSEKPKPAAQTEVVVPAPVDQAPVEQVATTEPTGTENAPAVDATQGQEQPGAVKASASPKAKKTDPAKTEKKKVTVDDLINDN